MKAMYLFINKHMKALAVALVACLIPVAAVPALGWWVASVLAAVCVLLYVGDYLTGWIDEI